MGIHNYYDMNNMISKDLFRIGRIIYEYIHRKLSDVLTFDNKIDKNDFIIEKYGTDKELPYIRENLLYRLEVFTITKESLLRIVLIILIMFKEREYIKN